MLLRLLVARLGSLDEAEDTLQDMWIKLEQPPGGPVAQPGAYLFRMAANLAADRRRSATRRMTRDTDWIGVQPGAEEQPLIERTLIARERLGQIEAALAAMPGRMAQALRMFRLEQRPRKDIAQALGISVSGVEKLLLRAYRQIDDSDPAADVDRDCPRRLPNGKDTRHIP